MNRSSGIFNRIVSKVKDGTQEYIVKKKISELENILVLESIENELFHSETINLKSIEKAVEAKGIDIKHLKGRIEEQERKLSVAKEKITSIDKELKNIREEFFDIDNRLT